MNPKNLQNIKTIFEERTGVSLKSSHRRTYRIPLLAAAIVFLLAVSAAAVSGFSALEGDALALTAEYRGRGIVAVTVENLSVRDVTFQEEVSLRYWDCARPLTPAAEGVTFSQTTVPGGETAELLIDLSEAYDPDTLETLPPDEDSYCLALTNNRFFFGNTWVVQVPMNTPIPDASDTIDPLDYMDEDILENVEPFLRFYFEEYPEFLSPEFFAMNQKYQIAYLTLFKHFDGTIVSPIENPLGTNEFIYYYDCEESLFDPYHSGFDQFKLVWDGYPAHYGLYKKVLSAFEHPACWEIQAIIPSINNEDPTDMTSNSGSTIPLLWLFTYPADMALPENYTFINGQLVTFAEMEGMKVYEDEYYTCYEISPLIYSDLDAYLARCCDWFGYDHYNEEMDSRVKNIHAFYKEHLPEMIFYIEDIWAMRDEIYARESESGVSEN